MITDQRLDEIIRSSLEWHADRAQAQQPTLRQATGRLAARVGPRSTQVRPRMTLAPATAGGINLLFVMLLLLLAALVAVVAGALLLRDSRPPLPGPFGFAAACPSPTLPTVELQVELADAPMMRLHAGGIVVTDFSRSGQNRTETVRQAMSEESRLTPHGKTLLLRRVTEAGLTPGCRSLRTRQSTGSITAMTAEGYVHVTWGPTQGDFRRARLLSEEQEAILQSLARELLQPREWLPEDAWDEPPVRSAPDQWLVTISTTPTDYAPGSGMGLPNGMTLDGSDPRYERVVLPGDADPVSFGEVLPYPPPEPVGGSIEITSRCGSLTAQEAVALAESLDQLTLGTDGWGDFFTEDLSLAVAIALRPAIPAGYDCESLYEDERPDRELLPTPTQSVAGDRTGVDPCALVPSDDALLDTLGITLHVEEVALLGNASSRSCVLIDAETNMGETATTRYGYWRAALTLYPSAVTRTEAEVIANGWLGDSAVEKVDGERIFWANDCADSRLECVGGYLAWSNGYLISFEHAPRRGPLGRVVNPESAGSFVDAVVDNLQPR